MQYSNNILCVETPKTSSSDTAPGGDRINIMEAITYKEKTINDKESSLRDRNSITGTWIWYSVEDRLLFSESFCRMTGYKKDSYYNFRTFFDILHGDDMLTFMGVVLRMLYDSRSQWITFKIIKPDNTIQKVDCFMESVSAEFGEVYDIIGVCYEIHD